tara:strand:- start:2164 stop:2295 length:132 start_codon:yes stop_codon:yes gene_type:complete
MIYEAKARQEMKLKREAERILRKQLDDQISNMNRTRGGCAVGQ